MKILLKMNNNIVNYICGLKDLQEVEILLSFQELLCKT